MGCTMVSVSMQFSMGTGKRPNPSVELTRKKLRVFAGNSPPTCVPGMARNYVGESPTARFSQSRRLAEGQGRHREVGSEGSPTQSGGAMNKNRILGVVHPGRAGT